MNEAEQQAFAEFLVKVKKVLTQEDLDKSREVQQAMLKWGIEKSIDKVVIEKGLLDAERIASLLREFRGGDEELIPGYRIVKKLGEGAMGEVFHAVDLINGERPVAIKILYPHLGKRKATAQRFLREAELCIKKLNHPNIVKGYEVGYEGGHDSFFYAMELVEGSNLGKFFKEKGHFSEEISVKIMMQMASALKHAFQFHLVHRDVKPDNIILTPEGDAKLCDLGLARDWAHDLSLTKTGAVMGTPYYISPEAAGASHNLDCRSDIYSLGATMYHMSTGRVPFSGATPQVVLARHVNDPLVPPIEVRPDLTPDFSAVLQMMMEKDPEDRYQSPTELIEDLEKLKEGETTRALQKYRETVPAYRPKKTGYPPILRGDEISGSSAELEVIDEVEYPFVPEPERSPGYPGVEMMRIEDGEVGGKRQDTVEEYLVGHESPTDPRQADLWSNFFTSTERRALSKVQTIQSKLLVLGAIIGGAALIMTILLCYVLIKILTRWF